MATTETRWVPALVIEGKTTAQQRARNYAFYERLRDGVPGDYHQSGLKQFVFEVPVSACTMGGKPPMFTFRLDPDSECYRRLVQYIVAHTDEKCDADDEVLRLRARVAELEQQLATLKEPA